MRPVKLSLMTAKDKQAPLAEEQYVVGMHLQKLRQEKLLTLEEVSQATRISLANLRAIESMTYERLPADVFTKGQITLYGNFLGLDGRQIAKQFFFERDGDKEKGSFLKKKLSNHSLTPKQLAEPSHISSATIAGLLLLLIVCTSSDWSCWEGAGQGNDGKWETGSRMLRQWE